MALARDHHAVVAPGRGQRAANCTLAVVNDLDFARDALPDLSDDARRVFVPGIVVGDDDHVGKTRRDFPHQRPLAPIAVPAATEHAEQPSRGDFTARAKQVFKRLRGMRVVNDCATPGGGDALHPPAHRVDAPEQRRGFLKSRTLRNQRGSGGKQVGGVETADQTTSANGRRTARAQRERNAVTNGFDVLGDDVGFAKQRVRRQLAAATATFGKLAPEPIAGIDYRPPASTRREQLLLRRGVVLKRGVIVKVVAPEVGEHREVHLDADETPLG